MNPKALLFMVVTSLVALQGCSYIRAPDTLDMDSQVGGTGDIRYTHEPLGAGKHLVSITAAPGLMETDGSIAQRIHIFANKFAAKTCPVSFEFAHDPNLDQAMASGFMKRTKTYVFICKA